MDEHTFEWQYDGRRVLVAFEQRGQGPPLLLLPSLSTTSTREEMRELAARLAARFTVTLVDWPGFGASARLPLPYGRVLYTQFLRDFASEVFASGPVRVAAAGHAAGYVLRLAFEEQTRGRPAPWARAALIAPTWRGPLPTAMGEHRALYRGLEALVRLPLLGTALYRLNTARAFLRFMYRRHVYGDARKVTPRLMRRKQQVSRQPGARFAAAAFVTGTLDPARRRAEALDWIRPASFPLLIAVGRETPRRSWEKMNAWAEAAGVQPQSLPGALGLHEESPEALSEVLLPFLLPTASQSGGQ